MSNENTSLMQAVQNGKFNGYHLKLIALITMVIDHIAAVVLWRLYLASYDIHGGVYASEFLGDQLIVWVSQNQELVYTIYEYMRIIGRMAFPIYCFLIVEGFLHTRSVGKYAFRLLAFAFISEIPFDMAIAGSWLSWDYSNVFFTLCLGLVLIWGVSYVEKFYEFWQEKQWDVFLGKFIVLIAAGVMTVSVCAFAEIVLKTDYGYAGVLSILVIYLFRRPKEVGFALSVFLLTILSSDIELFAFLMLYPISRYDGTRGKNMKYVFYAFYPVHLLMLALLCILLGV